MRIRCKVCGKELEAVKEYKGQSCRCTNETYIRIDKYGQPVIMATDLSQVEVIDGIISKKKELDKPESMPYTKRKPRKLDYEVR